MSRNVFEIEQGLFGFSLEDPGTDIDSITIADFTAFSCQVTSGAGSGPQHHEQDDSGDVV